MRPSVLEQYRLKPKSIGLGLAHCGLGHGLGLAGLVLCCETRSCTLFVIMILKDTATFQVPFIVSLFCAWNVTTVEINSGTHVLKSKIRQVPLFTSGGLDLGLGLVSSGLGLGLVILVLVLVLRIWSCLHH